MFFTFFVLYPYWPEMFGDNLKSHILLNNCEIIICLQTNILLRYPGLKSPNKYFFPFSHTYNPSFYTQTHTHKHFHTHTNILHFTTSSTWIQNILLSLLWSISIIKTHNTTHIHTHTHTYTHITHEHSKRYFIIYWYEWDEVDYKLKAWQRPIDPWKSYRKIVIKKNNEIFVIFHLCPPNNNNNNKFWKSKYLNVSSVSNFFWLKCVQIDFIVYHLHM